MTDTADLDELLLAWEEAQGGSAPVTPEQLCVDRPELLSALRRRLEQLAWVNQLLGTGASPPATPVLSGTQLGRYRLEVLVGAGGFGQVWRGYDPQLDRHVAVKLLHPCRGASPQRLDLIIAEARSLARLKHPHIVSIYDAGRQGDSAYLVTEFVEAESLQARLQRGALDRELALTIVQDIGRALDHAHHAGIVHCDVKPANILVTATGHAYLTDFGIAASPAGPAVSGEVQGTPGYMAPEQAGCLAGPVSPATDVYSLGRVLLTLLLEQHQLRLVSTDAQHQVAEVRTALEHARIAAPLRDVCLRATAWIPADRFPSAAAMVGALDRCHHSHRLRRLTIGRRGVWYAVVALLGGLILAGAFAFWPHQNPPASLSTRWPPEQSPASGNSASRLTSWPPTADAHRTHESASLHDTVDARSSAPSDKTFLPARPAGTAVLPPPSVGLAATIPEPAGDKMLINSLGMQLVLIPAGEFLMGSQATQEGRTADEQQHRVRFTKPFYMGVYEVTQAQYERVMGANPSGFTGPQLPVERVTWSEAVGFCDKLSALPGEQAAQRAYCLPTEAQWEYACRAGNQTCYSYGDDSAMLIEYAWVRENSLGTTHAVGEKQANAWGLFDMHGNVKEWCADYYRGGDDDRSAPLTDPTGPLTGSTRVWRGGSWNNPAWRCRTAFRRGSPPDDRGDSLGFRVISFLPAKVAIGAATKEQEGLR